MISRRARFAIAAMLDVARLARGKPLPARMLAAQDGLAPRQFETVLQDLVRAGLLRSVRGPQGGYELARERRRISIGAIVRAIGAPGREDMAGPDREDGLETLIAAATAAFLDQLDRCSIEDLCQKADPAQAATPPSADFHI